MPVLLEKENPDVFSKRGKRTSGVPREKGARWYVGLVKSRLDKRFASKLAERCVSYFLPMQPRPTIARGRRMVVMDLIFPGFVFFLANSEDYFLARETRCLYHVLKTDDQKQLRADLQRLAIVSKALPFWKLEAMAPGATVRFIKGHALAGLQARVDERDGTKVILDVHMVGAAVFQADAKDLEVVHENAIQAA